MPLTFRLLFLLIPVVTMLLRGVVTDSDKPTHTSPRIFRDLSSTTMPYGTSTLVLIQGQSSIILWKYCM
jgi:hypothetical protein